MLVGLHDADNTNFPNLALMKLSAAYKSRGASTELYKNGVSYDKVVSSKVFSFTPENAPEGSIRGGWGRKIGSTLPEWVEHICPDYDLYGLDYSLGFLTRGCIRRCEHCFVPAKEGPIEPHAEYTEFTRHGKVIFMDNNVLACEHGVRQIELLGSTQIKIDFNQGLDARLIDPATAKLLSKCKWAEPVRLACDSCSMIPAVEKAIQILRMYNVTPRTYSCYVLARDLESTLEVLRFLKGMNVDPFVQPYIDEIGTVPPRELRRLARWANLKKLYKSVLWDDYCAERGERL
jgi:hypothetical protein